MACSSRFITSSLRLLSSTISSRVISRDSMKDRSSSGFFLPNWFPPNWERAVVVLLSLLVVAKATRDWMDRVVKASVVDPVRVSTATQMTRMAEERALREIMVDLSIYLDRDTVKARNAIDTADG